MAVLAASDSTDSTTAQLTSTAGSWLNLGITIALIVLFCLVVRFLLHRAINRLVSRTVRGTVPVMLRPLRGRAKRVVESATGLESERRRQRAETIGSVLKSVVSITVAAIGVVTILGQFSINLALILASAGVVGVALGFGAQNLVKDFLNGIFMILEDQYGVGDIVDLGEASGTIEAVGLRTTRIRDADGVVWYVRNGEVVRVGNKSQGTASVNVDLPIAHGTDLARAQDVLQQQAEEMFADETQKDTLLDVPQVLGVESVTATGITLRIVLSVRPVDRFAVARDARERFTTALERAGITAPALPFAGPGRSAGGAPLVDG